VGDDLSINTDEMTKIANAIKADTDHLTEQTKNLMGQLDDVYLNFPPGAANLAQESQISLNAVFKRVRDEDARISEILQAITKAVEQLETKLTQAFTPHN
jgi:archaellum component FlaC